MQLLQKQLIVLYSDISSFLKQNKYILLDVLLCSITEYFYECAVFWRARRASQNANNE